MDCCVILNITSNGLSWPYMVMLHCCYSKFCYWYINISIDYSLLISYEKLGKLNKFIKVMLCVSLICLNLIYTRRNKLYINYKTMFESLNRPTVWIIISTWKQPIRARLSLVFPRASASLHRGLQALVSRLNTYHIVHIAPIQSCSNDRGMSKKLR
jgi:hypothetical protein